MELAFRNARVVTADDSFLGSVLVRDGRITDSKTMIGLFWLDKLSRGEWR